MTRRSEPDDVELFVGGVEPEAGASTETARAIEEYKRRPEYRFEVEEAERILASLDINARDYGMPSARSLLDHWHRCVADLLETDRTETRGRSVNQENHGLGSGHDGASTDPPRGNQG